MITRVQIRNINAIDYCDVDFEKCKYKYLEDMIYNDKLVSPIAFYGTNGSGKSSFFKAIASLLILLTKGPEDFSVFTPNQLTIYRLATEMYGTREWSNEELREVLRRSLSSILISIELGGRKYEYYIETATANYITEEYLSLDGSRVFWRKENEYEYKGKRIELEHSLFPTLRKIAKDEIGEKTSVIEVYEFLSNMAFVDANKREYLFKAILEKRYRDVLVEKSDEVVEILKEYKEFPLYDIFSTTAQDGSKSYYVNIHTDNDEFLLPYEFISSGMQNQSVMLSMLLSLPENSVLFIDEIEDALHPLTILDFLKVAQEKHIQLIFSSHNTFILQKLRPDQIFFANWKNGYSSYKKLADIYPNIREINNIEKMYLSSLFDEEIKNG